MFNLNLVPYYPNAQGMKILHLLAKGLEQNEIAKIFNITLDNLRWHIAQLKLKLGVKNMAQLMFEFGKYQKANE